MIFIFLLSLSYVSAYLYQCDYDTLLGGSWGDGRSMESIANCNPDTGGYLEWASNPAYGFANFYFNAPADYSNKTLYSVAWVRDDAGAYYQVMAPRAMPNLPGQQLLLQVTASWSSTGDDTTAFKHYFGGQTYVLHNTIAPELQIGDGSAGNSHAPMYAFDVYWDACDFTCLDWQDCQTDDTYTCLTVSDGNGTGFCPIDAYNADYQEFITACDYCTPSWSCSNYGDCIDDWQNCTAVIDLNDCYSQTGLAADNYTGDYSEFGQACGGEMAAQSSSSGFFAVQSNLNTLKQKEAPCESLYCKIHQFILDLRARLGLE